MDTLLQHQDCCHADFPFVLAGWGKGDAGVVQAGQQLYKEALFSHSEISSKPDGLALGIWTWATLETVAQATVSFTACLGWGDLGA